MSAKPLINASPTRSQLAAVSAIKILLVGVERLILAPQLPQEIASFLTNTVTIFSVCCPHFWQRIRSIVQSEVEKFIKQARGKCSLIGHRPNRNQKRLNFWNLGPHHSISRASVAATFGSNIAVLGKADVHAFYNLFTKCRYERGHKRCCNDKE